MNSASRLAHMQDTLGEYASGVTASDTEDANFPNAVDKVLGTALRNILAAKDRTMFQEIFRVQYADGLQMITIGGLAGTRETAEEVIN